MKQPEQSATATAPGQTTVPAIVTDIRRTGSLPMASRLSYWNANVFFGEESPHVAEVVTHLPDGPPPAEFAKVVVRRAVRSLTAARSAGREDSFPNPLRTPVIPVGWSALDAASARLAEGDLIWSTEPGTSGWMEPPAAFIGHGVRHFFCAIRETPTSTPA